MQALKRLTEEFKKNSAKSYETYLKEQGKDRDVSYYDALSEANTKRALTDADYGASAEGLLSSGLSSSGFRDYLESSSEQTLTGRVRAAEEERALEEYRTHSGYERYLSDYNSLQSKISEELIKSISKEYDFDYENAFDKAVAAGLSETLARSTAADAVTLARINAFNEAITFAKINKLSANEAKKYAKSLGLSEVYAERVYNEISVLNDDEKKFFSSMSPEQYYDYIVEQFKEAKKG